jgi:hypothetical protein
MIYWGTDFERFVRVFQRFGAVLNLKDAATPADSENRNKQMDLVSEF